MATNGCFDLLHTGHITYLEKAKSLGDYLIVGINGDQSVKNLKGDGRPINNELDRARLVAALECVDAVAIFPETRATRFLEIVIPSLYVKGGDYTIESLDAGEKEVLLRVNADIAIVPLIPNKSTTLLISKL